MGLSTTHAIWSALKKAYSDSSVERIHSMRDSLRTITKGNSSSSEYSNKFKLFCDKVSAIGHAVNEIDKLHWFLCGLGASFETF